MDKCCGNPNVTWGCNGCLDRLRGRDEDYKRAVEEAARLGAKIEGRQRDGTWCSYGGHFVFYWDLCDYRVAPPEPKPGSYEYAEPFIRRAIEAGIFDDIGRVKPEPAKPREWWIRPNPPNAGSGSV